MSRNLIGYRIVSVLVLVAPCMVVGCASAGTVAKTSTNAPPASLALDIDASRAHLKLADIQPAPAQPKRPDDLKPLSDRAVRQIDRARALIAEQRYTEAAIQLERALRFDPNHPSIHRTLALLHWEAGNIERSRTHAEKAMAANPDDAGSHYVLGRYHALTQDGEAIAAFRTALLCSDFQRHAETAALCHYELGRALAAEEYLSAALEQYAAFERAVADHSLLAATGELGTLVRSNHGSAALPKAGILERLGRFKEAAQSLALAVAVAPDDTGLSLRYADLLLRAGRLDDALVAARNIRSDKEEVLELLARIHEASGHPGRIIDDLQERLAGGADEPRIALRLAHELMRLKGAAEAHRSLSNYLDGHPDAVDVRLGLVEALVEDAAWRRALRVAADGIERHPDRTEDFESRLEVLARNASVVDAVIKGDRDALSPGDSYLRGIVALAAGRFEDAASFLQRAYTGDTTPISIRVALAGVYLRSYRYAEAIEVAGRHDEGTPEDARLELLLGRIYERLDDETNAERHLKAAIQLDRANTDAMMTLAQLYRQGRGRNRIRAQRQLRVLLDIDPNHEEAREMLAFEYLSEGKIGPATEQMEELRDRATNPLTGARCAAFLAQAGKPDPTAYRRALLSAIEQHGEDAAIWLAVADSYEPDREVEQRRDAFQKALSLDPENEEAAEGLIDTSRRLLAFEDAVEQLKVALHRRPNRHRWRWGWVDRRRGRREFHPGLIELYWIIQDYETALTVAHQGVDDETLDASTRGRYRLAVVQTLRAAGRLDDAIKQLEDWRAAAPDDDSIARLLASEYLKQDQPALALPFLLGVRDARPNDARAVTALISALAASGQHERAAQYSLDTLSDDPENDSAVIGLAVILADGGDLDNALELIGNHLIRTLDRVRFQDLMTDLLNQNKRFDDAVDLLNSLMDEVVTLMDSVRAGQPRPRTNTEATEILIRQPNEPFTPDALHNRRYELRARLFRTRIAARDYRACRQELEGWIADTTNQAEQFEYLRRLAVCYRAEGNEEKTSELLQQSLIIRPNDLTLNNDIAYGWIDRGVRIDEAERMARFALSRLPRQSAYLDTYGWLMYKKGEFEEAKKWLLRADHARTGPDPVIQDHLGDTLWRLGQADEAVRRWEAAIEGVTERTELSALSADERRVRDTAPRKIEDARAGRDVETAPKAQPSGEAAPKPAGDNDSQ